MSDNKDNTTTSQMDISIDELLGTPGAENVMVPESKPSLFSRNPKVDIDKMLLEKTDDELEFEKTAAAAAAAEKDLAKKTAAPAADAEDTKKDFDDIVNNTSDKDEETEGSTKKGGRPTSLVELGTRLVEKGYLTPFEGEEDLTKYTTKDWEELFDSNEKEKDKKIYEKVSSEFYENLPEEMQVAAHYFANGGKDLKAIFRSLAAVEEIRQLDTADEGSQEQIVRSYLYAQNPDWTPEEIEEEIEGWKDRDELEAKANKFKPKLDAMQEQVVARQLQQQEAKRKQQQQQAALYTDSVYKTLEPGEINGIKLDKKMQNILFSGLTQANYPSVSGRQTNLLGHLLEKYQYVEPNHALITEALWLLSDPEGYRNKVKGIGGKEQVEKTVRTLKTEESKKISSSSEQEEEGSASRQKRSSGIARPAGSFFKR